MNFAPDQSEVPLHVMAEAILGQWFAYDCGLHVLTTWPSNLTGGPSEEQAPAAGCGQVVGQVVFSKVPAPATLG
jgi:hypothetical protein